MDRNTELWSSIYQRFNVCCFHACTVCLERLFLHHMFCIFGHNYTNYNLWSIVMLKRLNTTEHVAFRFVNTAKALIATNMHDCLLNKTNGRISIACFAFLVIHCSATHRYWQRTPTLSHNFVMRWALVVFSSLRCIMMQDEYVFYYFILGSRDGSLIIIILRVCFHRKIFLF